MRPAWPALAAFLAAAGAFAQAAPAPAYSISIDPDPPTAGEVFYVTILIPEVSASEVAALEPDGAGDPAFVSLSVSSARIVDSEKSGARIVYAFRPGGSGELRIPRLEVSAAGSPLPIGPILLEVRPSGEGPPTPIFEWKAPPVVTRWQCFPVTLERLRSGTPGVLDYEVPGSPGLSLEPAGEGSFLGIALETGDLLLPPAVSRDGGRLSESRRVRSRPGPREIEGSRAVGDFEVRLIPPAGRTARVGDTFVLRVEVRGRGNLPVLRPPELRIRGPEGALVPSPSFPTAELRMVPGACEGWTGREYRFSPAASGQYTAEVEPFPFLRPETGEVRILRSAPLRIFVEPALPAARAVPADDARLTARVEAYAGSSAPWSEAAERARDGRTGEALELLAGMDFPEARHLEGILRMASGEGAQALAALGAAERLRPGLPGLAEALELCESGFDVGPRIRDRLPPPRIFLALSVVLLTGALVVRGIRCLPGNRGGPRRDGLSVQEGTLLAAACLALLLYGVSALERRRVYAVVAAPDSYAVPSESAFRLESFRGRAGTVSASSTDWVLLRFPDGRSAWFRSGDILAY